MMRPGNPYLMRAMNRATVIDMITKSGPISQTRICNLTGLSRATVCNIVQSLKREGLVVEVERAASKGGGRRQVLLELNKTAGYVVGIDLGGTKIAGVVTDLGGRQVVKAAWPTHAGDGPQAVLNNLIEFIEELISKAEVDRTKIRGVGVGVPGIVRGGGTVQWAPALLWRDLDLRTELSRRFPYPVFVENDVNLLALGEYWYGAGQGCQSVVCLAVGTGLGAGIIVDGQLLRGAHQAAGEVCNLVVDLSQLGKECTRFGHLETYASGTGLAQIYSRLCPRSVVPAVDAEAIFELARNGDPAAVEAVDEFTKYLALAVVALATVIDPEVVILGGGVANAADVFAERLVQLCRPVLQAMPDVRVSVLGVEAGVMGAVALTLHMTSENPFVSINN